MKSIGVDIVKNSRFKSFLNDNRKISRILSTKEIAVLSSISNEVKQIEYIASRFCVKEALFKAGIKEDFNLISVLNHEDGKPYIEGDFVDNIQISISHEEEYTIAFAIVF
ncbi:MAG: 4'-phosphopantetheinyl transferase superfamily protein [Bacilli bacterium]